MPKKKGGKKKAKSEAKEVRKIMLYYEDEG